MEMEMVLDLELNLNSSRPKHSFRSAVKLKQKRLSHQQIRRFSARVNQYPVTQYGIPGTFVSVAVASCGVVAWHAASWLNPESGMHTLDPEDRDVGGRSRREPLINMYMDHNGSIGLPLRKRPIVPFRIPVSIRFRSESVHPPA